MIASEECCICYCKLSKTYYIELQCCKRSKYCANCILLWWSHGKVSCPLCRSESLLFRGCIENRTLMIGNRTEEPVKHYQLLYTGLFLLYAILIAMSSPINGPMYTFMFAYTFLIVDIK